MQKQNAETKPAETGQKAERISVSHSAFFYFPERSSGIKQRYQTVLAMLTIFPSISRKIYPIK